ALRGRGLLFRARGGVGRSVALYMGGVALTSVIAVIATAPFAVANFNQLAVYGLLANMIGVPLTALWIMPLGVMAFLLMPVGLESWALIPMGWGIEALLATAAMIADLPGAVVPLMAPPPWGLGLLVLGALWLCLWRHSWRWLGLPAVVVGAATVFMVTPPDLLVTGDGRLLGVYGSDGRLAVSSLRRERFAAGIWAERSAARATLAFPPPGHPSAGPDGLRCDATACLVRPHGRLVALVSHPAALAEDCATADVVVSLVPVRGRCSGPHTIIDRFDLWRGGAHALWLSDERIRLRSDRDARGWRPWVLLPPAAR
ncbi:MAG: ComEC/Rec2 family competence protein, partial [Alphaproteobacteria bacterium]